MISNQGNSLSAYEVSKKVIHLLRHGQHKHREDDGAVQFWINEENLQKHFPYCLHWSDSKWKAFLVGGGGGERRLQYCADSSGAILFFRALQGHSRSNLTLQDNVIIQSNFFHYIYHVGCAIINLGLIRGGQNLNNRLIVLFLLFDPRDRSQGS